MLFFVSLRNTGLLNYVQLQLWQKLKLQVKKEYGENDGWDCLVWVTVSYHAEEGMNS